MQIPAAQLTAFITEIFVTAGARQDVAGEVAIHLVEANLKGHDSHGVGMTPAYIRNIKADLLKPHAEASVHKDNGAVMVIDGNFGFGQVVGRQACDRLIERTQDTGVVVAGIRNCHHLGRIGTYAEHIAAQGLISLHMVNVVGHNPVVAPFGGRERRFTTNPFTCAIPRKNAPPVVLDMATSAVAMGKVRVAYEAGRPAPEGALIDHEGLPTTDPAVLFTKPVGALGPFGNHKGYGLAVICELLGGALAGEWTAQPEHERGHNIINHMFMMVLDPAAFGGLDAFQHEVDEMIKYIQSSEPAKGVDRVRVPGEPERESKVSRLDAGIPIADGSWQELITAAEAAGMASARIAQMTA